MNSPAAPLLAPGLEGIAVVETSLSQISGNPGAILYRNLSPEVLMRSHGFEEIAWFLWFGELPGPAEMARFRVALASRRQVPAHVRVIVDSIPASVDCMGVLQTAVSALRGRPDFWPTDWDEAMDIAVAVPAIIALRHARSRNRPAPRPREDLDHVEHYFYQLRGRLPDAVEKECLEMYLTLVQELGTNPSTFSARLVTSTGAGMAAAISAAIGTLKGSLHGGAPAEVIAMLENIGTPEQAPDWLAKRLERRLPVMGFGHRIFKVSDPRSALLHGLARKHFAGHPLLELAETVEESFRAQFFERRGRHIVTNVDFYAAVLLSLIGFDKDLLTPTFAVGRVFGWTAHIMEQAADNRLIYPHAHYRCPDTGRAVATGAPA